MSRVGVHQGAWCGVSVTWGGGKDLIPKDRVNPIFQIILDCPSLIVHLWNLELDEEKYQNYYIYLNFERTFPFFLNYRFVSKCKEGIKINTLNNSTKYVIKCLFKGTLHEI